MTNTQAAQIVAYLSAAFRLAPDKETVAVWAEQLRTIDGEAGHVAAQRLIAELDRMPSIHQFIETAQEEARILAQERQPAARALPGTETTRDAIYRCGTCLEGDGQVIVSKEGQWTVHPCPDCNSDTYELWRGGHFDPDHECAECTARRKGRKKAATV